MKPMIDTIRKITWIEKDEGIIELLLQESQDNPQQIVSLPSGLEAEVVKITADDSSFVLKVWNKESKPEVGIQYKLLDYLYDRDVAVSRPYGWGINEDGHQVLLTGFNGFPITKVDKSKLTELARILLKVHQIPIESMDSCALKKYDFVKYFFPSIEEHPDIYNLLMELMDAAKIKQDRIIHGDYIE